MTTYGFIFARGGSKGLPGKNIKPLNGKPLICYAIDTAKSVQQIDKVFVSTDDAEIAEIAEQGGAEIILRPSELAQDDSPEWLAWRHAACFIEDRYGAFDEMVVLPATSPLRSVSDVDRAIEQRRSDQSDICISVTPASRNPYFNMVVKDEAGLCSLAVSGEKGFFRRQDAPEMFDITTVVYATTVAFVNQYDRIFDGLVSAIEVPKERAVDIDDIYDFMFAESLLSYKE